MTSESLKIANRTVLIAAARALGRIDRDGMRGLTGLSVNEIEAMALSLVMLGLVAIPPGSDAPETLIQTPNTPEGDDK